MTSTTFDLRPRGARKTPSTAKRWADLLAGAARTAKSIGSLLRMPAPGVPEATAQLLRMAEAYESTQPSYAADLRAAATSMGARQQWQAD